MEGIDGGANKLGSFRCATSADEMGEGLTDQSISCSFTARVIALVPHSRFRWCKRCGEPESFRGWMSCISGRNPAHLIGSRKCLIENLSATTIDLVSCSRGHVRAWGGLKFRPGKQHHSRHKRSLSTLGEGPSAAFAETSVRPGIGALRLQQLNVPDRNIACSDRTRKSGAQSLLRRSA